MNDPLDLVLDHLLSAHRVPDGEPLDVQKAVHRLVAMSLNFDIADRKDARIYLMRPDFSVDLMVMCWNSAWSMPR